jgi:hypothetical protein
VDEMQHPVMGPAEPENLQFVVGVADEIAVGEEQQLDDVPAQTRLPRGRRRLSGRLRIRIAGSILEIYVSHIDISWVQCYKTISRDETLSRLARGDVSNGRKRPEVAAKAANWSTVRLSSGISANILDFRLPQKHVVCDLLATATGRRAGIGEGQA